MPKCKPFEFSIGQLVFEDLTHEKADYIKSVLQSKVEKKFVDTYDQIWAGEDLSKI